MFEVRSMIQGLGIEGNWIGIHDADPRAIALYRRHYSSNPKSNNSNGIAGPGERMILCTVACDALFVWRPSTSPEKRIPDKRRQQRLDSGKATSTYWGGEEGIMCSVFRNEGPLQSSSLILEAEELAWNRWPGQRLFTYVWDAKIKSVNPGYCFKMAGWRACGRNKDGRLTILEKYAPD